ncbi:MAG: sugar nucleotide-binding protein [Saprospiraceae bacterium]
MPKILVTGAQGQLGKEFQYLSLFSSEEWEWRILDRASLDITDASACEAELDAFRPDFCINTAAYTAVDRAEEERDIAFAVNAQARIFGSMLCFGGLPLHSF